MIAQRPPDRAVPATHVEATVRLSVCSERQQVSTSTSRISSATANSSTTRSMISAAWPPHRQMAAFSLSRSICQFVMEPPLDLDPTEVTEAQLPDITGGLSVARARVQDHRSKSEEPRN
jgi:hypothetical protein